MSPSRGGSSHHPNADLLCDPARNGHGAAADFEQDGTSHGRGGTDAAAFCFANAELFKGAHLSSVVGQRNNLHLTQRRDAVERNTKVMEPLIRDASE